MERVSEPTTRRRDKTGRDMVLSLSVLLVPILVIGAILRACGSSEPTVIDPSSAIDNARRAALFTVIVPEGLGPDWRSVSASFARTSDGTAGTLRLGYLAPGGGQVQLVESNEEAGALLSRELGEDVRSQGEVRIDGQAWASSLVRGEERALVLAEPDRTVIGVGRASPDELTTLAAALR